jgi:hypothetical protein
MRARRIEATIQRAAIGLGHGIAWRVRPPSHPRTATRPSPAFRYALRSDRHCRPWASVPGRGRRAATARRRAMDLRLARSSEAGVPRGTNRNRRAHDDRPLVRGLGPRFSPKDRRNQSRTRRPWDVGCFGRRTSAGADGRRRSISMTRACKGARRKSRRPLRNGSAPSERSHVDRRLALRSEVRLGLLPPSRGSVFRVALFLAGRSRVDFSIRAIDRCACRSVSSTDHRPSLAEELDRVAGARGLLTASAP